MSNSSYNYEKWLEHHANRKTMLQKLERSLVPFELFEAINLQNNREAISGEIMLHGIRIIMIFLMTTRVLAMTFMMRVLAFCILETDGTTS